MVISYVTLFFAASGGMVGVALLCGIRLDVGCGCVVFHYGRAGIHPAFVTGM